MEKPPIGIKPKNLHDLDRLIDLKQCINSYIICCYPINIKWIEEYNQLIKLFREKSSYEHIRKITEMITEII